MRKLKNFVCKHKGKVIGTAIALVFVISLIATMGGGSNNVGFYDTGIGYQSGFDVMMGSTSVQSNSGIFADISDNISDMASTKGNSYSASNSSSGSSNYVSESESITSESNFSNEVNFGDKIIYNGNINIKSGDIPKTLGIIRNVIEANGGYITNIDTSSESYGSITARVPSENCDKVVNDESIEKGNTVRRTISSKDVSLEYSDEQAELETLKIKEERILSYFKSATDVETMLRLESELQRVRSSISSSEKRLRMMDSYVSYSEINFRVNSRYTTPDEGAPFSERVKYTVEETMHFFKELSIGIVLTAIKLIPLAIYGTVLFFVVRAIVKFRRKRRKNKVNKDSEEESQE